MSFFTVIAYWTWIVFILMACCTTLYTFLVVHFPQDGNIIDFERTSASRIKRVGVDYSTPAIFLTRLTATTLKFFSSFNNCSLEHIIKSRK